MLPDNLHHAIRLDVVQLRRFPVRAEHDQPGERRLHPAIDVAAQRALVNRVIRSERRDDGRKDACERLALSVDDGLHDPIISGISVV